MVKILALHRYFFFDRSLMQIFLGHSSFQFSFQVYQVGHKFPPDKNYQFPRNVCRLAKKIGGKISIWMNSIMAHNSFSTKPLLLFVIGWNLVVGRDHLARIYYSGKSRLLKHIFVYSSYQKNCWKLHCQVYKQENKYSNCLSPNI